jgi:phage terminase large subunit
MKTLADDFAERLRATQSASPKWPNPFYRENAPGFFRDILGLEPWAAQMKILKALETRDYVSCRSGHRVGKTVLGGGAGLWFYGTRPGARVFLLAWKGAQVRDGIWKDTRKLFFESRDRATRGIARAQGIDGRIGKRFDTGLSASDGREIKGRSPEDEGALQGLAGELLFIVDEASLVDDEIFTVISSNLAGGGKLLLLGNPNRSFGYFFRSFTDEKFKGAAFHVPSTDSPNIVQGRIVIPYLANEQWLRERKQEWGVDSPTYKVRVLGEFVEATEGRLFPPDMIQKAEHLHSETEATGPLVLGIDPAGDSGDGDESAFAPRRGKKVTRFVTRRGLTPDGHVIEALGIAKEEGTHGQPTFVIDIDGSTGWKVWKAFCHYLDDHPDAFRAVPIKGMRDERRQRRPHVYLSMRDELWHNLREAFREGLAIPPDELKLVRELAEMKSEQTLKGLERVTLKDDLRRALGRSPDRADALTLCAWVPSDSVEKIVTEQLQQQAAAAAAPSPRPAMDPYQRADSDDDDAGMDPYSPAR